jgi:hypothetical protein
MLGEISSTLGQLGGRRGDVARVCEKPSKDELTGRISRKRLRDRKKLVKRVSATHRDDDSPQRR